MKSNQMPNFIPKNIIRNITQLTENGIKHSELASKGEDWHSVVDLLDESEHLIGREMSVNSHLNAVMFSESFNEEYEKTLPIISNYYSEIGGNKSLYNAFKRLKKSSSELASKGG